MKVSRANNYHHDDTALQNYLLCPLLANENCLSMEVTSPIYPPCLPCAKLYIPSTINNDYLLLHTQLVVYALAYFDPNKYTSMPKYAIFLTFLLVTFLVCLVWMLQCTETLILLQTFSLQVNLFQKHLFLHQLTHNMTKYCSLNYKFST